MKTEPTTTPGYHAEIRDLYDPHQRALQLLFQRNDEIVQIPRLIIDVAVDLSVAGGRDRQQQTQQ